MKTLITIFKNKLTLGFVLGLAASFLYAFLLKLSLEHFFDIYPTKGGLNIWDIGYFFSIAFWRILIDSYLQLALSDNYKMSIASAIKHPDYLTLFTNRSDQSSSNENTSFAKGKESDISELNQSFILQDEMMSNLKTQNQMIQKLLDLKRLNDLKYYEVNGALELDGPSNLSDSQLIRLSREVGTIDRIINTKVSEYSILEKKLEGDLNSSSKLKESISDYKKTHGQRYKSLFEK